MFGRKRRNKSLFNTLKINQLGSKYFFHQVKIILSAQKSCFLVDLRSFLLAFFVWTENKGAFTVTKKLQRLIPVALFSKKLQQVSGLLFETNPLHVHPCASKHYSSLVQQV